jgi:hypothetical protein
VFGDKLKKKKEKRKKKQRRGEKEEQNTQYSIEDIPNPAENMFIHSYFLTFLMKFEA